MWCVLTLLAVHLATPAWGNTQEEFRGRLGEGYPLSQTHGRVWPFPKQWTDKADTIVYGISRNLELALDSPCAIIQDCFDRHYPYMVGTVGRQPRGAAEQRARANMGQKGYNGAWGSMKGTQAWLQVVNISVKTCDEGFPTDAMDESYTLSVNEEYAEIVANEVWGAIRAIETLTQLTYSNPNAAQRLVRKTYMTDAPRFKFRGFLIDTSRHYLNMRTIEAHLDAMEMAKLNVLHWHIVDSPSFPYVSKVWPLLSTGAYNPYTHTYSHEEVLHVVAYARLRGIRVVPEFDTPGHTLSWGVGYPEVLSVCNDSGIPTRDEPLDPTNQYTYSFVETLFNEVIDLFPDTYLFLGGDEVSFTCWQSNDTYAQFMADNGISDYQGLQGYYTQRLLQIVADLPKPRQPLVWQEVFDNGNNITEETFVDVWKSSPTSWQDEEAAVTSAGYQTILSAPWYLNYISYGEDWKKFYVVNPTAFNGTAKQKALVVGGEACMWGEYVDSTNFMSRTWPRAAAVAERLWSPESVNNPGAAEPRYNEFRCRMIERGIQAEPLFVSFCTEEWPFP